ncbi:hypothetical protein E2C01_095228 [Portunus trituberculatus]|uniref:Uncharacterized protein n=1 Tax=Portunus trituberculatus TaxID=210409 RepID=A0A5B7JSJ3_PORTR|nr:hypothetical protein [Portunus trituberculatus]
MVVVVVVVVVVLATAGVASVWWRSVKPFQWRCCTECLRSAHLVHCTHPSQDCTPAIPSDDIAETLE